MALKPEAFERFTPWPKLRGASKQMNYNVNYEWSGQEWPPVGFSSSHFPKAFDTL
jgi:hypothetical protein